MKYVIIIMGMIAGIFIATIGCFNMGLSSYQKKHSHPEPLPRSVEAVNADLETEMLKSNAMLDGLHWFMINDQVLWKSFFENTSEYRDINCLVDWGNFDSANWKAKDELSYEDYVRTHY